MSLVKKILAISCLPFFLVSTTSSQTQDTANSHRRFSNQDVIEMVKLGLSDDVIIAKIRTASAAGADTFSIDTSVEALKTLKESNVSDAVIKVMIGPSSHEHQSRRQSGQFLYQRSEEPALGCDDRRSEIKNYRPGKPAYFLFVRSRRLGFFRLRSNQSQQEK